MRVGIAPTRLQTTDWSPARVTACVLTYIPNEDGYYSRRLAVLSASLLSLARSTPLGSVDVLVFDNASCQAVVDRLKELESAGIITFLLRSNVNIGKANAWRVMFNTAPGEVIAYSDDDVLFYPGWLEASMSLLERFPEVGMVSALPVGQQFRYGNSCLTSYQARHPDVVVRRGHFLPEAWHRDFAASIGYTTERDAAVRKHAEEIVLERQGARAYATATHFQFLGLKATLLEGLAPEWETRLLCSGEKDFDERIDALGYVRLSTEGRYVRHLGNVIGAEDAAELERLEIDHRDKIWHPPSRGLLATRKVMGHIRRAGKRGLNWLYLNRNFGGP